MEPIIIGISGVTNGGKTTLCQQLVEKYPTAKVYNMDDYYWGEDDPHHVFLKELNHMNWDVETSADLERLASDVKDWRNKILKNQALPPLIIVEGIFIFEHEYVSSLFTKKYFLTLDESECWNRRRGRSYIPPDPPGYFKKVAWPEHVQRLEKMKQQTGIEYIDGKITREEICSGVSNEINRLLSKIYS